MSIGILIMLGFAPMFSLSAQDLWDDRAEFFTSASMADLAVGSVVTVEFDDDFNLWYTSDIDRDKIMSYNDIPALGEWLSGVIGEGGSLREGDRSVRIRTQNRSRGSMGAVITGYNPESRTYTLASARGLAWNGSGAETLTWTAIAGRDDISPERTISSGQLANLQMAYRHEETAVTLTAADFEQLIFPTEAEKEAARAAQLNATVGADQVTQIDRVDQSLDAIEVPNAVNEAQGIGIPPLVPPRGAVPGTPVQVQAGVAATTSSGGGAGAAAIEVPRDRVELSPAAKERITLRLLNLLLRDGF